MSRLLAKEIQKNKAEAMNKLHAWLNQAIPQIEREVARGYRTTSSGEFFKRDGERFSEIIKTSPFRAIITPQNNCIHLMADIRYKVGEHTVDYYKRELWIFDKENRSDFRTNYIYQDIRYAKWKIRDLNTKIDDLRKEIELLRTEFEM